jgi:uncharacterized repeat protein (TIGR03803 family)
LIQGPDGALFGATEVGGTNGLGTIFKARLDGTETVLVSFNNLNGSHPRSGLVLGRDGSFYGTTALGGDLSLNNHAGFGTIFKVTPEGTLTTLVKFNNSNGAMPAGVLVQDDAGNFVGTAQGVNVKAFGGTNHGTIFKMTPAGALTTLARFNNSNGAYPQAGLLLARDGNFYGTTEQGAAGYGTVFKMTPAGFVTTLVSFDGNNGSSPEAGLIQGSEGDLYGTTAEGGAFGGGTVFKVSLAGAVTILYSFDIPPNQYLAGSWGPLLQGLNGNFYGMTHGGNDHGTIFGMTSDGAITTLVTFDDTNGSHPEAGLLQGADGKLYGATYAGGANGMGTLFRLVLPPPGLAPLQILQSGDAMVISWPAASSGAVLEGNDSFSPENWSVVPIQPAQFGDQNVVTVDNDVNMRFFRLRK